jgi:hypothetical protein
LKDDRVYLQRILDEIDVSDLDIHIPADAV